MEHTTNLQKSKSSSSLAAWGRVVRLHTALATALIPIVAHITVAPLTIVSTIQILSIAVLFHSSICTMNDYLDYEDDLRDPEKQMRPLVSGDVDLGSAKLFIVVSAAMGLAAAAITGPKVLGVTIVAATFATLYNYHSGNRVFADVWYVLSIISVAILGAAVAGGFNYITLMLIGALTIHGFYQVQEGHMKDLNEDESNVIQWIGLDVRDNGFIKYPEGFIVSTYGLKIVEMALLLGIVYLNADLITQYSVIAASAVTVAYVGNVALYFSSLSNWLNNYFDRSKIVKSITLHEVSGVMLILLTVMPMDPVGAVSLMIATPLYLVSVNMLIHSDPVSPDI